MCVYLYIQYVRIDTHTFKNNESTLLFSFVSFLISPVPPFTQELSISSISHCSVYSLWLFFAMSSSLLFKARSSLLCPYFSFYALLEKGLFVCLFVYPWASVFSRLWIWIETSSLISSACRLSDWNLHNQLALLFLRTWSYWNYVFVLLSLLQLANCRS